MHMALAIVAIMYNYIVLLAPYIRLKKKLF